MPLNNTLPAPMTYVQLIGTDNAHSASDATWEDWDLSALVPAGTLYVLVGMGHGNTAATFQLGVRETGSALDSRLTFDKATDAGSRMQLSLIVPVDSARKIQRYGQTIAQSYFSILGYWI